MGFVNWQVQKTASGEQHQEVTTRLVNLALRCLVKILAQVIMVILSAPSEIVKSREIMLLRPSRHTHPHAHTHLLVAV